MECLTIETHVISRRTAGLALHPVTTTRRHERISVGRFHESYGVYECLIIIRYLHN